MSRPEEERYPSQDLHFLRHILDTPPNLKKKEEFGERNKEWKMVRASWFLLDTSMKQNGRFSLSPLG
jgi:hypothetical protein